MINKECPMCGGIDRDGFWKRGESEVRFFMKHTEDKDKIICSNCGFITTKNKQEDKK